MKGRGLVKRRGSSHGPSKKAKRPRSFWKRRQSLPLPVVTEPNDVEESGGSSSEDADEEGRLNNYDTLLTVFGRQKEFQAIDSTDEEEDQNEMEGGVPDDDGDSVVDDGATSATRDEDEGHSDQSEDDRLTEQEPVSDGGQSDQDEPAEQFVGGPDDPFMAKYSLEIADALVKTIESKSYVSESVGFPELGRMLVQKPNWAPSDCGSGRKFSVLDAGEDDVVEEDVLTRSTQNRLIVRKLERPKDVPLTKKFVKQQLSRNVEAANQGKRLSPFQRELFSVLNSTRDFMFSERTPTNGEQVRLTYTLHALNHILKSRRIILLNNARKTSCHPIKSLRDQGLCRPRILIVVPFKESAHRIVNVMSKLLFEDEKAKVANRKRFDREFSAEEVRRGNKPDDYYDTFTGNIEDEFKIGMAVTKTCLKLYTDFYSSDIIVASPLGLRLVLGAEGDDESKREYDFLTSIEMLIMDQMDVFAMQNWEHVTHIMSHLHLKPVRSHGVDFSRVRLWSLNNQAVFYRQTLLFSSVAMPEVTAIFNKGKNYSGRVRLVNPVVNGCISQVIVKVPVAFHRFDTKSPKESVDDRFRHFTSKVMPDFKKDVMFHTFVFVPSYFDVVRLRKWFRSSDLDFLEINEYLKDGKIAKARDHFYHNETHFLLYTERVHFYRRFAVKGIRHLIFYQLPQYAHFFAEMCNLMHSANQNRRGGSDGNMSCTVLYSRFDSTRLAAVMGSQKASDIIEDRERNVRVFVPGS